MELEENTKKHVLLREKHIGENMNNMNNTFINPEHLIQKPIYHRELLKREFRELKKKLGRCPFTVETSSKGWGYRKYFGSWNNFLREMGEEIKVDYEKKTKEELIQEYFRVKKLIKKQPTLGMFVRNKQYGIKYCSKKYINLFGNWTNFLKSIGEPLNQNNVFAEDVSKEELMKNLYELKENLGRNISWSDLRVVSGISKFGTAKYRTKYGLKGMSEILTKINGTYRHLNIPVKDLIEELRNKAKELKHIPTSQEFGNRGVTLKEKLGMGWTDVIKLVFGKNCEYNFIGSKTNYGICPVCNKKFAYYSSYMKGKSKIYCSMKCRDIYSNNKTIGEKGDWAVKEYIKGETASELARKIGANRNSLVIYFRNRGIKIRNRSEWNIGGKK